MPCCAALAGLLVRLPGGIRLSAFEFSERLVWYGRCVGVFRAWMQLHQSTRNTPTRVRKCSAVQCMRKAPQSVFAGGSVMLRCFLVEVKTCGSRFIKFLDFKV